MAAGCSFSFSVPNRLPFLRCSYVRIFQPTPRGLDDRLFQRLVEIDDYQRRTATSTDASLRRVHSDMQHLSGGLLDIIMSVQRLEDKLDRLSSGDGEWRTSSSPQRSTSAIKGRPPPPANRRVSSRGDAVSNGEGLKRTKAQAAEKETVNRKTAVENVSGQPNVVDSDRNTDMPMEVIVPVRRQEAEVLDASSSIKPSDSLEQAMHPSLDTKIGEVNRMLERIAVAVGVKVGSNEGDDEEDRKRLKEKLKVAIELDRRTRVHTIVSSREVWLEYIFGICSPDKRVGKRGSRFLAPTACIS